MRVLSEYYDPALPVIWRNGSIPVVYQPQGKQPLLVRLPYRTGNREWILGNGKKIMWRSQWKAWELPRSRFNSIVASALERFGKCWLIQEYRPLEKCAPACWNALGYECQCSCLGANHGSGQELKHVINESFAFEYGERKLACRLLEAKTWLFPSGTWREISERQLESK